MMPACLGHDVITRTYRPIVPGCHLLRRADASLTGDEAQLALGLTFGAPTYSIIRFSNDP